MFDIIKAIVLGIVEGVTEFLPVSSTGHLILINQFLSFDETFTALFDVVIQLGAILAAVWYFREQILPQRLSSVEIRKKLPLWSKAIIGVIPALVLGFLFGDIVEEKLFNPWVVALALLLGGIVIVIIEKRSPKNTITDVANLGYMTAFWIGLIQCLALIPGTSRSAATIIGGLLLGASRTVATEFSFFLAIPTMCAATAYSLLKHWSALDAHTLSILTVGFVVSFATAMVVIKYFMLYIQKNTFTLFGYYRIILGVTILGYFFFLT